MKVCHKESARLLMFAIYSVRTLQMEQSKLGLGLASSASKAPQEIV